MNLKSGFKLGLLGSAGIGGTSMAVWGMGSINSRNDTTYDDTDFLDIQPQKKELPTEPTGAQAIQARRNRRWAAASAFFKMSDTKREAERAKDWGQFIDLNKTNAYGASLDSDKAYANSPYFGSLYTGCFEQMFDGTTLHDHRKFQIDNSRKPYKNTLKIPKLTSPDSGQVEGCFGMLISRQNNNFLLSSEIALKQGDRGVAIWTGIKNGTAYMPSSISDYFPVHSRNFMVLLERANGETWEIKGGYSWGGRDKLFQTRHLKIQSIGGTEIDQSFSKTTAGYARRDYRFYYGKWSNDYAGNNHPITLHENWYQDKQDNITLIPNEIYGHGYIDVFLDVKNRATDSQPWKRHKKEITSEQWWKEDPYSVSDAKTIEDWLSPFTTADGAWIAQE